MKYLVIVALGFILGTWFQYNRDGAPKLPGIVVWDNTSWIMSGVPMLPCPDDHIRTVEVPERDEVDALTVKCMAKK